MIREIFRLSDGRNFEYLKNGQVQSHALILNSGTTQDITGWQTWLDYLAGKNIFALAIGRSGYAASSNKPGRITIDIANDIAELSTALGIKRFVNIGLSGGGQHAIATGLDPRSVGVVTIGSLAPYAEMGKEFFTGMQQADIDEYADAITDIDLLIKRFKSWQDKDLSESIAGDQLSANDLVASSSPTWQSLIQSCEFTMSQGWDWVADDYSSYLKPWGFDPRDLRVPVIIWQGGLDKNVPKQHGSWLAKNIPNARYELREDESHLGIFVNYEREIMESAIDLLKKSINSK